MEYAFNAGALATFPPELASVLCTLLPEHPLIKSFGPKLLGEALTRVFFASLQSEEHEHHPIRVALSADSVSNEQGEHGAPGWQLLRFQQGLACTTRNLLRLSRAARAERLFVTVTSTAQGLLMVTGLAREGFGHDDGAALKVRAHEPGSLEVWVAGRRVIEYVRGYLQAAPEDVLLSAGRVRAGLLALVESAQAPAGYVECVASIIRHLADHPHGGIVVLSADDHPAMPSNASFALQSDRHLWNVLHELASNARNEVDPRERASGDLLREALRAEIERTISEIGSMTSLDGATILDRRLGVRGFGVVLPVRSDISVVEVMDAAGKERRPFPLDQYGARHRAAASHAASHAGSLVFMASTSGDIGCMLRDERSEAVLLWRFRSADLASPAP